MVLVVAALYFVALGVPHPDTRGGARLQAVGGSAEAVRRIGVNADLYRILGFVLGGTCGALAGLGDGRHHPSGLAVGIGEPAVRRARPRSRCRACRSPAAAAASRGCSSAR